MEKKLKTNDWILHPHKDGLQQLYRVERDNVKGTVSLIRPKDDKVQFIYYNDTFPHQKVGEGGHLWLLHKERRSLSPDSVLPVGSWIKDEGNEVRQTLGSHIDAEGKLRYLVATCIKGENESAVFNSLNAKTNTIDRYGGPDVWTLGILSSKVTIPTEEEVNQQYRSKGIVWDNIKYRYDYIVEVKDNRVVLLNGGERERSEVFASANITETVTKEWSGQKSLTIGDLPIGTFISIKSKDIPQEHKNLLPDDKVTERLLFQVVEKANSGFASGVRLKSFKKIFEPGRYYLENNQFKDLLNSECFLFAEHKDFDIMTSSSDLKDIALDYRFGDWVEDKGGRSFQIVGAVLTGEGAVSYRVLGEEAIGEWEELSDNREIIKPPPFLSIPKEQISSRLPNEIKKTTPKIKIGDHVRIKGRGDGIVASVDLSSSEPTIRTVGGSGRIPINGDIVVIPEVKRIGMQIPSIPEIDLSLDLPQLDFSGFQEMVRGILEDWKIRGWDGWNDLDDFDYLYEGKEENQPRLTVKAKTLTSTLQSATIKKLEESDIESDNLLEEMLGELLQGSYFAFFYKKEGWKIFKGNEEVVHIPRNLADSIGLKDQTEDGFKILDIYLKGGKEAIDAFTSPPKESSFKKEAESAVYRLAAKKSIDLLTSILIKSSSLLNLHPKDMKIFLSSPIGKVFLNQSIGQMLQSLSRDSKINKLSEEMRVEGLAQLEGMAIDFLFSSLAKKKTPPPSVRIAKNETIEAEILEDEEEDLTVESLSL